MIVIVHQTVLETDPVFVRENKYFSHCKLFLINYFSTNLISMIFFLSSNYDSEVISGKAEW